MGLEDFQDSDLCVPAPPISDPRSHKRTNENIEEAPDKRMKPAETELGDCEKVQIKLEIDPSDLTIDTTTDTEPQHPDQTESQHIRGGNIKLELPGCSSSSPAGHG